jgi:glycosyltransferase involved in cell wall biosynthesis
VIATDAVGAAAAGLVENGVSGFVVPERDPRSLTEAMVRVLSDDGLTATLAAGAREHVSHYTYDAMADAFESAVEFGIQGRKAAERSVAVV